MDSTVMDGRPGEEGGVVIREVFVSLGRSSSRSGGQSPSIEERLVGMETWFRLRSLSSKSRSYGSRLKVL